MNTLLVQSTRVSDVDRTALANLLSVPLDTVIVIPEVWASAPMTSWVYFVDHRVE